VRTCAQEGRDQFCEHVCDHQHLKANVKPSSVVVMCNYHGHLTRVGCTTTRTRVSWRSQWWGRRVACDHLHVLCPSAHGGTHSHTPSHAHHFHQSSAAIEGMCNARMCGTDTQADRKVRVRGVPSGGAPIRKHNREEWTAAWTQCCFLHSVQISV
jgi:hypothetical protein